MRNNNEGKFDNNEGKFSGEGREGTCGHGLSTRSLRVKNSYELSWRVRAIIKIYTIIITRDYYRLGWRLDQHTTTTPVGFVLLMMLKINDEEKTNTCRTSHTKTKRTLAFALFACRSLKSLASCAFI